ncbi:MAG TPA: CCA tRNA nucleotidyltransferase [Alphaproteobacteria bacterium]|jgi:poly(A) polymerase
MTPVEKIKPQDWMTRPATRAVMAALAASGATARFVGGCVRDALLRRAVGDIDIATDAAPDAVIAALEKAKIRAIPTGLAHGTVTAVVADATGEKHQFEITTLRRDVETDGRHARVAFTDDWAADAARRDFTMNALFLDMDGRLYDPCGGLDDAKRGRVRFVGDPALRLEEDVLRLLRYFRFFAHYDRAPADAAALAACRAAAPQLPGLSGERVRQELLKLLAAPDPGPAVKLMAEAGAFAHLLPEATAVARLAALPALERREGARRDPLRRLAALIEVHAAGAEQVAARLRLSNMEKTRLTALAAPELPVMAGLSGGLLNRVLHRLGGPLMRDLALLAWADDAANGQADDQTADDQAYVRLIAAADCWRPRVFPLTGQDALAFGLPPGPAVGRALAAAEDWWIERGFAPDRDACLAYLRDMISTGDAA